MPTAHDGKIAIAEHHVSRGNFAEVIVERAHSHPVIVDPAFDPIMGALLMALGERQAGDDAGRDATVAQQRDEQATLGGAVAALVLEAIGGADRRLGDAVKGRLVLDLERDVAIQRLRDVGFVFAALAELGSEAGDAFVLSATALFGIEIGAGRRLFIETAPWTHEAGHRTGCFDGEIILTMSHEFAILLPAAPRPQHLLAFRMAHFDGAVEQLPAVVAFAQHVLATDIERRRRLDLHIAIESALHFHGDFPGVRADGQLHFAAHDGVARDHKTQRQRRQASCREQAKSRP